MPSNSYRMQRCSTRACTLYPQMSKMSLTIHWQESGKGLHLRVEIFYLISIFFIKKKDGISRLVQDYRHLNEITVKNQYPTPLISELVDQLKNAKVFTDLDICWGYNNIQLKTGNEWKAVFVTNHGLFEPNVMFFGLFEFSQHILHMHEWHLQGSHCWEQTDYLPQWHPNLLEQFDHTLSSDGGGSDASHRIWPVLQAREMQVRSPQGWVPWHVGVSMLRWTQ